MIRWQAASLPPEQIINSVSATIMDCHANMISWLLFLMYVDCSVICKMCQDDFTLKTRMGHMLKWNKSRFERNSGKPSERSRREEAWGEPMLCFCLMEHNMSVLHGLVTTCYTMSNTSCHREHNHTNPDAAMLNAIRFNFERFCIVHHYNIMFSSFLSTYTHAPHCPFL